MSTFADLPQNCLKAASTVVLLEYLPLEDIQNFERIAVAGMFRGALVPKLSCEWQRFKLLKSPRVWNRTAKNDTQGGVSENTASIAIAYSEAVEAQLMQMQRAFYALRITTPQGIFLAATPDTFALFTFRVFDADQYSSVKRIEITWRWDSTEPLKLT